MQTASVRLPGSICLPAVLALLLVVSPASAVDDRAYCGEYFTESGQHLSIHKEGAIAAVAQLVFTDW
jgi:hypothetical protein